MDDKLKEELRSVGEKAAEKKLLEIKKEGKVRVEDIIGEIAAESVKKVMQSNGYVYGSAKNKRMSDRMEVTVRIAIRKAYTKKEGYM